MAICCVWTSEKKTHIEVNNIPNIRLIEPVVSNILKRGAQMRTWRSTSNVAHGGSPNIFGRFPYDETRCNWDSHIRIHRHVWFRQTPITAARGDVGAVVAVFTLDCLLIPVISTILLYHNFIHEKVFPGITKAQVWPHPTWRSLPFFF